MKLLEFYEKVLATLGVTIGEKGELLYKGPDDKFVHLPVKYRHRVKGEVSGKLYLPTRDVLSMSEDPAMVKFHPTGENCHREPSEVFSRLEKLILGKVNTLFVTAADLIFDVARHTDCHSSVSLDAMAYIKDLTGTFTDQDVKYWGRVQKKVSETMKGGGDTYGVIDFELKRNKEVNGKPFNRVMYIRNNIEEELEQDEPFGVRPPNKRSVERLRTVFGDLLDFSFSAGSNDRRCPNLHVLLTSYADLAKHFNSIFRMFASVRDVEDVIVEETWIREIKGLAKMHTRCLDMEFPGNIGLVSKKEVKPSVAVAHTEEEESTSSRELEAMRRRALRIRQREENGQTEAPEPLAAEPRPEYSRQMPQGHSQQAPQQPPQQMPVQEELSMEERLKRANSSAYDPRYGQPQMDPRYSAGFNPHAQVAPPQQAYGQMPASSMRPAPGQQPMGYPQQQPMDPRFGGYPPQQSYDPRFAPQEDAGWRPPMGGGQGPGGFNAPQYSEPQYRSGPVPFTP